MWWGSASDSTSAMMLMIPQAEQVSCISLQAENFTGMSIILLCKVSDGEGIIYKLLEAYKAKEVVWFFLTISSIVCLQF